MNGLKYAVLSWLSSPASTVAQREKQESQESGNSPGGYMFRRHVQLCHGYG